MLNLSEYFKSKKAILDMFPGQVRMDPRIGKRSRHVYVDNGAPYLLVAHIDTVQTPRLDSEVTGAGFDDRLGVAVAHRLVTEWPTWFDLLLTDYEESGGSTAKYFQPSHTYRLVVELDREGEDFVDYGLCDEGTLEDMEEWGFRWGWGTYTDICSMPYVECDKVNVGIGVYGSHSKKSGYRPDELERQLQRLLGYLGVDESAKPIHEPEGRGDSYRYDGGEEDWEEECGEDWREDWWDDSREDTWPFVDDEEDPSEEDWLIDETGYYYDPDEDEVFDVADD